MKAKLSDATASVKDINKKLNEAKKNGDQGIKLKKQKSEAVENKEKN